MFKSLEIKYLKDNKRVKSIEEDFKGVSYETLWDFYKTVRRNRNSNFYEVALVGPDCPNTMAPVYTCGYTDMIDCIESDGCVPVPNGIGLGVTYDWDYITANTTNISIYE